MDWPARCTSSEFDIACSNYDTCDIEEVDVEPMTLNSGKIYVSPLSRSLNTAKKLFPNSNYIELKEITEVPLRSFKDIDKSYPLWLWNIMGRLQWLCNSHRQMESRLDTQKRANHVIDKCEREAVDCTLVTHGFFMKTLLKTMKKRGYSIQGNNHIVVKNLQMIIAEKK